MMDCSERRKMLKIDDFTGSELRYKKAELILRFKKKCVPRVIKINNKKIIFFVDIMWI